MLVKLHDLNNDERIDRKDAYKAPNGYYYSSEEAYQEATKQKKMREECIKYMYDLMGYKTSMKMPTIFFKKLKEWESYGYSVIYKAMCLAETSLVNTLQHKEFKNESNKVSYISAVIANQLNDALKIEKRKIIIDHDLPEILTDDLNSIGIRHNDKSVRGLIEGV